MSSGTAGRKGWLSERVPLDLEALKVYSNEPVPNHLARWWWCLGGTPALLFVVQVVTGILLTFYYVPSPASAYESVRRITHDIPYGWYLRSLHRWSSHFMIVAVWLHMMRVFFTGAYRRPRELNWMIGMGLLGVTLLFGFTGYSLLYEQISYWGITVATNLTEAVPWLGTHLARLLRGGDAVGDHTLTRFFIFHIGVLPTAITILLALHILLVRLHGVTPFEFARDRARPQGHKTYPFYPDHVLIEVIMGIGLVILLSCLAILFPAGLGEPANPLRTPAHIKPEWYFFWTFRWLKLVGLTASVLSIGAVALLAFVWPFVDAWIRRRRPGSELSVWIGASAVLCLLGLTVWEALAAH
ncbi:MAG: cytochrome bc complex cytochrome b subunit [Myxococcales bacterium]|nr:cytochrome bc complex cytochrome b subunit [Myxococcota bacterium]MDW8282259.1 cytochrome bc complex cytochrome b subunit [Myxococcales bacterium]